eukprot:g10940.t1
MNIGNRQNGSAIPENFKNSVYSNPSQVAVSPMVVGNTANVSTNNTRSNTSGTDLLNTIRGNGNDSRMANSAFNVNQNSMGFHQQDKGLNNFADADGSSGTDNINQMVPSITAAGGVAHSMLQQQQYRTQSQEPGQGGYNSSTPTTQGNNDSAGGNDVIKNHSSRVKSKASVFQYKGKHLEIRDVYNDTLIQEMAYIRKLVSKYKYVAMDTEFPGVVARPISDGIASDQQYQTLRCNVDLLKIIQLGVAFFDENGELAPECPCWQFNFRFSLDDDMFAQDSIELLQHSGIDFKEHNARGIDVHDFGELLISSGLVLMPGITWITFHGGYDFGYLLKVLTCKPLPENEDAFFALLRTYFPSTYDEKYMAKMGNGFQGGLNQLGDDLQVERIGQMHQAGSDSLLTGQVFFKLRDVIFGGVLRKDFESILYGLGVDRAPRIFD